MNAGSGSASGGNSVGSGTGSVSVGNPISPVVATPFVPKGPVIQANPSNYLSLLRTLKAGDTLVLAPGDYDDSTDVPGLPIFNLNGTAAAPIVITGPESGSLPKLLGRATHNTVRLADASYIIVRNLEIDGRNLGGAGVATQGVTKNITIENLVIRGVGGDQQIVGISTNSAPTSNWTVRGNTILGAGTGMYFGNSDGANPFVAGLIENNVILESIGYNIQIKHQNPRPTDAGLPTGPSKTVIRNNVFSKSTNSSTGSLARPNLLVGHFPLSGPGINDLYEIYGNFFWQNPSEALFQGEGNVAFYSNLLVNGSGPAIVIQPHYDVPKTIRVFGNTVLSSSTGIRVSGGSPTHVQRVEANAVFAATPITATDQRNNSMASFAQSTEHLANPLAALGVFDASPRTGRLDASDSGPIDLPDLSGVSTDFDNLPRNWTKRGAYSSAGSAPRWLPKLERKP